MFINSKLSLIGLTGASLLALCACASHAPQVSNSALGYAVTSYQIAADSNEQALSGALGSALAGVGIATAMSAKADVTIDAVHYNSPFVGFFYGGQHYASLSVKLMDNSGARISSFPIYVAANGSMDLADADLASKAAEIIAAKAASAFMPVSKPAKPAAKAPAAVSTPPAEVPPAEVPVVEAPMVEVVSPSADIPCVIGPDGKCLVL